MRMAIRLRYLCVSSDFMNTWAQKNMENKLIAQKNNMIVSSVHTIDKLNRNAEKCSKWDQVGYKAGHKAFGVVSLLHIVFSDIKYLKIQKFHSLNR